jgi:uncharacterized protein involved in outer membrane biogenesis
MRVVKIVLLLAALLLVVAGIVLSATKDLDLSHWRPEVEAAVREATGRELSVGGQLEVDLLPVPRVQAQSLVFSNAGWGSRPEMLTAARVVVAVELWPLLFGDVNVRSIRLIGVDLLLETDSRGRGNWEIAAGGEEGASLDLFETLGRLDVDDMTIDWRNRGKAPYTVQMDIVRLTANNMGGVDLHVQGQFDDQPRQFDGQLSSFQAYLRGEGLRGKVTSTTPKLTSVFEGDLGRFPVTEGMDLRVSARGERWPAFSNFTGLPSGDTPPWEIDFRVRGRPGLLEITEGDARFEDGRITGSLNLNRQGETTRIQDLALAVDAKGEAWPYLATVLGFPEGPLPLWDVDFKVGGHQELLEITEIEALLDKSDLAGSLLVNLGARTPHIRGALTSKLLDISTPERWWQGTLEQETRFEDTGRIFSTEPIQTEWMDGVDLDLDISADTLTTEDLTVNNATLAIKLDGRRLEGDLKAEAFGGRGGTQITADASRTPMEYWQRTEILDADMRGVSEEWLGAAVVDAPGRFRYEISGAGNSVAEVMKNVSGSASLVLGPGTARAGVAERAVRGLATMALATLLHAKKVDDVEMNCMVSKVKIEAGVAEFEVLVLDTERATVLGSGKANLADETWDVWFKPKPKRFALNAAVPVHMTGPFHEPDITVQKIGILRKIAGAVSLFVFPPAAVAGLAEFGAGNPCVELLESD